MRSSFRESSGGPFSLFAFQDIIFSVTAVLLFATIWFALSTRVQRISREPETGELPRRLAEVTASVVAAEARQRLAEAGEAVTGEVDELDQWVRQRLAAADPADVAAAFREDVRRQEHDAAQQVTAMQDAAAEWEHLHRRLQAAARQARDTLLRPVSDEGGRAPVLVVIDATSIQLMDTTGRAEVRPVAGGRGVRAELEEILREYDAVAAWLWVGVKPSAAAEFDRVAAALTAAGFRFDLEPLPEDQSVAFYSAERARALLEGTR